MTTEARLTCPYCKQKATGVMPDDACVFFFECPHCKTLLRPREGDCCVFCSYGDHQCPPRLASIGLSKLGSK
jgi:hypothetical protein